MRDDKSKIKNVTRVISPAEGYIPELMARRV